MVSSPRFRSPRIRSAFAIVPVPEDSSIAYHKEIYTVLFDPPSFLMVHSIVCHLWKKSKMEKQFLPLPPLRKSLQEPSIQPLSDSIPEAEGEITSSSTSVLESSTANDLYNFRFGCFHHSSNFDAARKLEEFVTNLVKIDPVDLDSTKSTANRSISKISFSCFEAYGIDAVSAIRFFKQSLCINDFEKFVMEIDALWIAKDASIASLMIECTIAVPVTSSRCVVTIFDPGGVIEPLSGTILPGAITVEFVNDFVVLVFDPGGNRHQIDSELNFASELNLASGTPSNTSLFLIQLQTFASIIYYWISL
ncbi:hypothetical protein QL285_067160 [Trifolium repens]|nr:hypothetical protein QL285_067160 [Trifolium repens]